MSRRRFHVRYQFSDGPHVVPVEEAIRHRIQMHLREYDRRQDRRRLEDDLVQMGVELINVEGRFRRAQAAHKHKVKAARFEDWIEDELREAYDALRADGFNQIGRIRLTHRAHERIAYREVKKSVRDWKCARITVHKAERWLKRKR